MKLTTIAIIASLATTVSSFSVNTHTVRKVSSLSASETAESLASSETAESLASSETADVGEVFADPVSVSMPSGMDDLAAIATKSNPLLNYWDPLKLVDTEFYGNTQDATIGFLRHAEIKHGRVAMAAFVGYCVQSNYHFPWAMSLDGSGFPSTDLVPEAQWDAISLSAKFQMFTVIGAMEIWDEIGGGGEADHYMRGRQPGKYPSFQVFRDSVHPVLDLYDPFGLNKKMKSETKEKRLIMEINNGRLAMIGIMGFMSADAIPGSVPLLKSIAIQYDGQCMAPFE